MRGSLRERGENYWELSVSLGRDPITGKQRRRYQSFRGTKRDARKALTALQREVDTGIDINPERLTVAEYLARWLRDYAETNIKRSTLLRYTGVVDRYLIPALGSMPLAKLRPSHIQPLYAQWRDQGLAVRTIIKHHMVLSQALDHAVEWQMLSINPAAATKPPKADRYRARILDRAALTRALTEADRSPNPWPVLVRFAVATGMREGEIIGLRWADVDLERHQLRVQRTGQYYPGEGVQFGDTKRERSDRTLPLSSDITSLLRSHRAAQNAHRLRVGPDWQDNDLVFPSQAGTPLNPRNLQRGWGRLCRRAGIEQVPFHSLRHTCGSMLAAAGVSARAIADQLGHTSVNFTLNTYVHTTDDSARAAAETLSERLRALGE